MQLAEKSGPKLTACPHISLSSLSHSPALSSNNLNERATLSYMSWENDFLKYPFREKQEYLEAL